MCPAWQERSVWGLAVGCAGQAGGRKAAALKPALYRWDQSVTPLTCEHYLHNWINLLVSV